MLCKERGCLCIECKYFDYCDMPSNNCPGALCWGCNNGSFCVKECNKFRKKILDTKEKRVYNKIIRKMKER